VSAVTSAVRYAEDRSAMRWPLTAAGVLPVLLVAAFVVGVAARVAPLWGIAAPAFVLCLMFWGALAYRNWPTGIRITGDELRVGAVRSARAVRRRPTVTHQNWGLFTVPLVGVRHMTVETDPAVIRRLKKSPDYFTLSNRLGKSRTVTGCKLGVLTAPFMRSALVVELDSGWARFPATRRAVFFPNEIGRPLRTFLTPEESLTWVVPTRHPERLREAVAQWLPGDDAAR
jgi:hypothetical protein